MSIGLGAWGWGSCPASQRNPLITTRPNSTQTQGRRRALSQAATAAGGDSSSSSSPTKHDPFNPTVEHQQLRDMVRAFTEKEVDPQALAFNRREEVRVRVGVWIRVGG